MLHTVFHDMSRTELLQRLQSQKAVSSEACFVLLWTYLNQGRVVAGENLSRSRGVHPFKVEAFSPPGATQRERITAAIRMLETVESEAFDLLALRWLKALDSHLHQRKDAQLGDEWVQGLDGMDYRVRRRNNFLADYFQARVTSKTDQSGTPHLYTPHHMAVPRSVADISINIRTTKDWADTSLRSRLAVERRKLNVMLWPFRLRLEYQALQDDAPDSDFISLAEIRNEEALIDEIREALSAASQREVSLLIFPELAIPPAAGEVIRKILEENGPAGYPVLTLFGCCHRAAPEGGDLNEGLLLGPDGQRLHCHEKLAAFTRIVTRDRTIIKGERLKAGTTVSVLESPLGNLTPLICLDFIHKPLYQTLVSTHANLFAVPSLSDTTNAHRIAAKNLQAENLASSFVCNRTFDGPSDEAASFVQVPFKEEGHTWRAPSFLLFSLEPEMDKAGKRQV
jgi:Carbon-nitrogen hydrolase